MTVARRLFAILLALMVAAPAFAQAQRTYSQPELDQMLAPVALYPDALLSQVLMAATYPDEVRQAARWSRANPGLQGDDAVRAAQHEGWDPSVQSLVAFPQVLAPMYANPGWTQSLGDAFLMQEPQVMETVQQLRRRAQAAGNLQSSEQVHVQQQGPTIVLQPASPQYIYVPYYDPLVVYGPWWWPAYRPVVWAPWRPYGIRIPLGFFFGNFDWHHRHVRVVHPTAYYYRPRVFVNQAVVVTPHRWQHEPQRRPAFARRQAVQARPVVQARPQAPVRTPVQQVAPVARIQAPAAVQPQVRMPAAVTPQQPRAARIEQRQERRETRKEQRRERAQKG